MLTRFSFSFSRIFRSRSRREAKANASAACVVRRTSSEPLPSKSRRPVSSQLEPINTTPAPSNPRPRSVFVHSVLSPIAQSPLITSPDVTPISGTPPPIIIIGQDPAQSTLPPPPVPAPPGDVGPQIHVNGVDGVSSLESSPAPTRPNSLHVSFQLPTTDTEDPPETPLSTCSTLVSDFEAETGPAVPAEQPAALEAHHSGSVRASAEFDANSELDGVVGSDSGRARPISLFSPQPVRVDVSRFSLPVSPTAPTMTASTNASDGRRESKRRSLLLPFSGSSSAKKETRMSRWSKELSKPETQEVLRALAMRYS